ncbi:MAG: ATP phosphoribosyltransferase regulatory subunit [Campylobacterales bacterium]|nr:ATP phosphoribosyltransferase regulatory subunit [Campylobacterales bacterium]
MIAEYEIPKGTKLYFGASAKRKREIENVCVESFYENGFEEISTPLFSYHQELSDYRKLVRMSDEKNNLISLRADSSIEVVRIISKRLGRTTDHQKWFYVQPVFNYPTTETNQIGAEWIGCDDLSVMANLASKMLKKLEVFATLQIGNINIPKLVAKHFDLEDSVFENHEMEKLFEIEEEWLHKLISASTKEQIEEVMGLVPADIAKELKKLLEIEADLSWEKITFSPFYYADMEYYDNLYFRFIEGSSQIAMGGTYKVENSVVSGFGIYTDTII